MSKRVPTCCLVAWLLTAVPASAQTTSIRVTEAMSSSGVGGTADWFEVSNYSGSAIDISGWRMDDNSFAFANSVALNLSGSSIAANQTVVFIETSTLDPAAEVASFRSFWGGTASTSVIGTYAGSGISFSSAGDGLVLFNSLGTEATPRATFGAATAGSSFYYAYDAAGNPSTSPNSNAVVSTAGLLGGQDTYLSATTLPQNTGSPGTAVAVPEPSTLVLGGCGVALAAWACRRRASVR